MRLVPVVYCHIHCIPKRNGYHVSMSCLHAEWCSGCGLPGTRGCGVHVPEENPFSGSHGQQLVTVRTVCVCVCVCVCV